MRGAAFVGGCGAGLAAGWNIANTGAVAEELSAAYGVGLGVVGLLTTALFLAHMLMQLPSGRLSDRFGPWAVSAAGIGALAACNGVLAIAPSAPLALAARSAAGVGTALAFIGGSDLVRLNGGSSLAQGMYGGVATAGGGIALAAVPLTTGAVGWRAPYVSALVVAAVTAAMLALAPRDARTPVERAAVALGRIARDPRLLRIAAVFAASFGLSVVIGNWVTTLLDDRPGVSAAAAGAVASLTLVLGVVSRPVGGWIMRERRASLGVAVAASALLGAAGAVALAAGPFALAIAGAGAVGVAAGIPFAAAFTRAAAIFPGSPATAVGFVNGTGALTILLVTPLVGVALARDFGEEAFVVLAVLWAASVAAVPRAFDA